MNEEVHVVAGDAGTANGWSGDFRNAVMVIVFPGTLSEKIEPSAV